MKTPLKVFILAFTLILLFTTAALALSSYQLNWWTVDSGGGTSQGGDYTLQGTIGQPEAGSAQGEDYSLAGGFWARIVARVRDFFLHLPLISK